VEKGSKLDERMGDMVSRRSITGLAVALVMAASPTWGPGAQAAQGGGYAGDWVSVDTDGSNQTLQVRGSGQGAYGVVYRDDDATTCDHDPASLTGSGDVVDGEMVVTGSLVCVPGGSQFHRLIEVGFVYDSETDTLVDDFGVIWTRVL